MHVLITSLFVFLFIFLFRFAFLFPKKGTESGLLFVNLYVTVPGFSCSHPRERFLFSSFSFLIFQPILGPLVLFIYHVTLPFSVTFRALDSFYSYCFFSFFFCACLKFSLFKYIWFWEIEPWSLLPLALLCGEGEILANDAFSFDIKLQRVFA